MCHKRLNIVIRASDAFVQSSYGYIDSLDFRSDIGGCQNTSWFGDSIGFPHRPTLLGKGCHSWTGPLRGDVLALDSPTLVGGKGGGLVPGKIADNQLHLR
jgi:hypothetical protein